MPHHQHVKRGQIISSNFEGFPSAIIDHAIGKWSAEVRFNQHASFARRQDFLVPDCETLHGLRDVYSPSLVPEQAAKLPRLCMFLA